LNASIVEHGGSIAFQMAPGALSRSLFREIVAASATGPMLRTTAPGGRRAD
jgi:hypothetical protein